MPGRGYTLSEIVARLGGELAGDGTRVIRQVGTLERADADQISFLANPKYASKLSATRAAAVILSPKAADRFEGTRIVTADPYVYFARVAQLLNPARTAPPGIHPSATVEVEIPASASVGPGAHIGKGAVIGERVVIGAGCCVGEEAVIGEDTLLHAHATIYPRCVVGRRGIVHSGVAIGADGFGFAEEGDRWIKIPQIGRVLIGDDVEIGANTTIDRGALDDTVIEDDVKLDNQIQIGHNVHIGAHTAIAGCVGIAGSTRIGRRCKIGGAAMILGHLEIADDVTVAAGTMVAKSVSRPGIYTGWVPFLPHDEWLKNFSHLRRLDELADRIRALERRLAQLDKEA